MTSRASALALSLTAVLTSAVLVTPTAAAASSCVAQSVQTEHDLYSTEWGHHVIAYLASHPELLAEVGFESFGDLASYAARQDPSSCPPDL
jgi:hypothetical protein